MPAELSFDDNNALGTIAAVDTSRVLINIDDSDTLTRIAVGNLIAIRGQTSHEYLIGTVEKVTRTISEEVSMPEDILQDDSIETTLSHKDLLRAVLIGTYYTVFGDRSNYFKRGADHFPKVDKPCFHIEGDNLQKFMNLLSEEMEDDAKLKLGQYSLGQDASAIASGDKFFQRHATILGSTGSGKSWAVALLLERAAKLAHPNLIVLDMHGEYAPLANDPNGYAKYMKVAGPGELGSNNDENLYLPFWLLNREEMLAILLDRSDQNAPNQSSRFSYHVQTLKQESLGRFDKQEVLETFTVDSPIPYSLQELVSRLKTDDDKVADGEYKTGEKKGQTKYANGPWSGKLTRFVARLETKISDRRYGFMFSPPDQSNEYDWLARLMQTLLGSDDEQQGIKIIDFSEVPSDVLPVVVAVFSRLLYDVQFWMNPEERTPITLVCDEAHLYLPVAENTDAVERQAVNAFERIAKEGRKYGASLLVVSQRPSDVSRTILSQCNNFLILRLTNDRDQSVVRRLLPEGMAGMVEIMPLLDTGEALLIGDSILLPTRIRLDKPDLKPASATRNFWTDWANCQPSQDGIAKAIETLRKQSRE